LKASNTTSAKATGVARPAGRSSDRPPSPTTAEFRLAGPSDLPDPSTHAYRKDLADIALAGRVIASHYAEPLPRTIGSATALREAPTADSGCVAQLEAGEPFEVLDNSLGWAWGYAGAKRLVGYVKSEALGL
jgi:hypothetical protein